MLDMKRLVSAFGLSRGGFRAEIDDLVALDHPAIVPIHHGGFKHFVVVRTIKDNRVFIADPQWEIYRLLWNPSKSAGSKRSLCSVSR